MDAILPQLASSIILALLSWVGSQFLNWLKRQRAASHLENPSPHLVPPGAPPPLPMRPHAAATINYGEVVLQIGILQLTVNIVGVILSLMVGASGANADTFTSEYLLLQLPLGTLTAIITFFIFGLRVVKVVRWRHLTYVALGTVVLTLVVNSLLTQTPILISPAAITFALIQTFAAMGIGGALAQIFGSKAPASASQAYPQSYAPYSNAPYPPNAPYPYGGVPSVPLSPPPAPNASPYPAGPSVPFAGPPQPPPYAPQAPYNPYGPYSAPNPQPPYYQPPHPQVPGGYQSGRGQQPPTGYGSYPPAPGYGPPTPMSPHPPAGAPGGSEGGQ